MNQGTFPNNDESSYSDTEILEEILDIVKAMAGDQLSLWDKVDDIDKRLYKVEKNTSLVPYVRKSLTRHSQILRKHDTRITILESTNS